MFSNCESRDHSANGHAAGVGQELRAEAAPIGAAGQAPPAGSSLANAPATARIAQAQAAAGQELAGEQAKPPAGSPPATSPATAGFPEVLDVEDLARYLKVSARTIARMRAGGRLLAPTLEIGMGEKNERHELRWFLGEVRAWLEAGCPSEEEWQTITDPANRRRRLATCPSEEDWRKIRQIEEARRRRRQRRGE